MERVEVDVEVFIREVEPISDRSIDESFRVWFGSLLNEGCGVGSSRTLVVQSETIPSET